MHLFNSETCFNSWVHICLDLLMLVNMMIADYLAPVWCKDICQTAGWHSGRRPWIGAAVKPTKSNWNHSRCIMYNYELYIHISRKDLHFIHFSCKNNISYNIMCFMSISVHKNVCICTESDLTLWQFERLHVGYSGWPDAIVSVYIPTKLHDWAIYQ